MEQKHFGIEKPDPIEEEGSALIELGKMGAYVCVSKEKKEVEVKLGSGKNLIEVHRPTAVDALEWVLAKRREQQRK